MGRAVLGSGTRRRQLWLRLLARVAFKLVFRSLSRLVFRALGGTRPAPAAGRGEDGETGRAKLPQQQGSPGGAGPHLRRSGAGNKANGPRETLPAVWLSAAVGSGCGAAGSERVA